MIILPTGTGLRIIPFIYRLFNHVTIAAVLGPSQHIMLVPRGDLYSEIKQIEHVNLDRFQQEADWKTTIHKNSKFLHILGLPSDEKYFRALSKKTGAKSIITYRNEFSFQDKITEINWYECNVEDSPLQ